MQTDITNRYFRKEKGEGKREKRGMLKGQAENSLSLSLCSFGICMPSKNLFRSRRLTATMAPKLKWSCGASQYSKRGYATSMGCAFHRDEEKLSLILFFRFAAGIHRP